MRMDCPENPHPFEEADGISSCMASILNCTALPMELPSTIMQAAQQREVVRCLTLDVPATLPGYQREDIARMQADDVGISTGIK